MEDFSLFGLIKIGEGKYLKKLFEHGEIYMQTLTHFKNLEDGYLRGDAYEGADSIDQLDWIKIKTQNDEFEFSSELGNLSSGHVVSNPEYKFNVYSMGSNPIKVRNAT